MRALEQGVTDSTQFYPEDRTISAAIEQGRKVAGMIREASSLTEPARAGVASR